MGLLSWGQYKILAHIITSFTEEKGYKAGRMTGFKTNEECDKRYKEKNSEDIQRRIALGFAVFYKGFTDEILSDWEEEEKKKLMKEIIKKLEE